MQARPAPTTPPAVARRARSPSPRPARLPALRRGRASPREGWGFIRRCGPSSPSPPRAPSSWPPAPRRRRRRTPPTSSGSARPAMTCSAIQTCERRLLLPPSLPPLAPFPSRFACRSRFGIAAGSLGAAAIGLDEWSFPLGSRGGVTIDGIGKLVVSVLVCYRYRFRRSRRLVITCLFLHSSIAVLVSHLVCTSKKFESSPSTPI